MKKNRSTSIPRYIPAVNIINTPRNHSTLRKNHFLNISLKSPNILRLTKENLELRGKLRDFNDSLNSLIFSSNTKALKSPRQNLNPEQDLQKVVRNLEYYENEHKRIENRIKLISDHSYETKLKEEIEQLQERVQILSENLKKNEIVQKKREKILETVLDTGEKQVLHKEFMELNTDITVYTKRIAKLEEINLKTEKRMNEIKESLKKLDEKLIKRNTMIDEKDDSYKNIIEENNVKLARKFGVINGEFESKKQVLSIKIKKLTEELENTRRVEEDLKEKLQKISIDLRKKQKVLLNLQDRNSPSSKKALNDDYMIDELVFMNDHY